eukprot:1254539-Rhodomonas_salina.4
MLRNASSPPPPPSPPSLGQFRFPKSQAKNHLSGTIPQPHAWDRSTAKSAPYAATLSLINAATHSPSYAATHRLRHARRHPPYAATHVLRHTQYHIAYAGTDPPFWGSTATTRHSGATSIRFGTRVHIVATKIEGGFDSSVLEARYRDAASVVDAVGWCGHEIV